MESGGVLLSSQLLGKKTPALEDVCVQDPCVYSG